MYAIMHFFLSTVNRKVDLAFWSVSIFFSEGYNSTAINDDMIYSSKHHVYQQIGFFFFSHLLCWYLLTDPIKSCLSAVVSAVCVQSPLQTLRGTRSVVCIPVTTQVQSLSPLGTSHEYHYTFTELMGRLS